MITVAREEVVITAARAEPVSHLHALPVPPLVRHLPKAGLAGLGAGSVSAANVERVAVEPRANWQSLVESQGLHFHTADGIPYWDESAYYRFSTAQIDVLESATYQLNELCLQAVQHVVDHHQELFPLFSVPPSLYRFLLESWDEDEFTLYGRFDFSYDGKSAPRLLEYNADTPTSLLEASVVQWYWMQDLRQQEGRSVDQFNNIHERLIWAWQEYKPHLRGKMYFGTCAGFPEDFLTVNYLRDTAIQAGLPTDYLDMDQIRWDSLTQYFVHGVGTEGSGEYQEWPIRNMFKLYPWEWMMREEFAAALADSRTKWLEAPWKVLLSNKAILPILHRLNPDCPYLLPADFKPLGNTYVKKPTMAREGACVTIVREGETLQRTPGMEFYEAGPYVFQQFQPLPEFEGRFPVIGSWLVNGWACGIGIRESETLVTGNTSRFIPHIISDF